MKHKYRQPITFTVGCLYYLCIELIWEYLLNIVKYFVTPKILQHEVCRIVAVQ